MWIKLIRFSGIMAVVGIVGVLIVMGVTSMVELWYTTQGGEQYIFAVLCPLIAGACAVVCYLFYDLFARQEGDYFLPQERMPPYKHPKTRH